MSAKKKSEPVPCHRTPCDTAFSRGAHFPDEDGNISHRMSWGGSCFEETTWQVSMVTATDDGPWYAAIRIDDGTTYYFTHFDEVADMAGRLAGVAVKAAEANMKSLLTEVGA